MNRARRAVTLNRKPLVEEKVSDDSADDFESASDEGDFSASEEEWLPGKDEENDKEGRNTTAGSISEDDDDNHEDEDDDEDSGEMSDGSSVMAMSKTRAKKRSHKSSPKQNPIKKKRMSPATRDELYRRTKKHLLKESQPDRPSLNASVADILSQCEFKPKRNVGQNAQKPSNSSADRKGNKDNSDSDSGDDYLVNPEKLDLNSDFFKGEVSVERTAKERPPQFDCNAGMRLSDSSDNENEEDVLPASIPKLAAQKLISTINKSSAGFMNFNNLEEFDKKIAEAKLLLKNYKSKEVEEDSEFDKSKDISNLLALGEPEAGAGHLETSNVKDNEGSNSEESDWEEVADVKKSDGSSQPNPTVTVELETTKSKKKRWEEIEMELFIKRQVNKIKRENQLAYHKSSILLTIGIGQKLNYTVNSNKIQAMTLSLMQAKDCIPKSKVDRKFIEQLIKWFKACFTLQSQEVVVSQNGPLRFNLALELFTKKATCKRNYMLLFLSCLRMAGVQARLIISANVPPKRPAMKDLCPISERQLIEQFEKEYKKKNFNNNEESDTESPGSVEKKKEIKSENDNIPVISITALKTETVEAVPEANNCSETAEKSDQKMPVTNSKKGKKIKDISADQQNEKKRLRTRSQNGSNKTHDEASTPAKLDKNSKSVALNDYSPSVKENIKPARRSPRNAKKSVQSNDANHSNTLSIPQVDGANDIPEEDVPKRRSVRLGKVPKDENVSKTAFSKRKTNTPKAEETKNQPGKVLKRKLFQTNQTVQEFPSMDVEKDNVNVGKRASKNKILSSDSEQEQEQPSAKTTSTHSSPAISKAKVNRRSKVKQDSDADDSDFEPPKGKKSRKAAKSASPASQKKAKTFSSSSKKTTTGTKSEKKATANAVKSESPKNASTTQGKNNFWIEFYSEKDNRWMTVDLFGGKIDCVDYLSRHATSPISYVFGFDNDDHIKDVTPRYVQHWNTVCRMLRTDSKWLDKTLAPFRGPKTEHENAEDQELNKIDIDKPLPTTIAECKNHPLYVLKRHLLKFEALYPVEVPSLGFVRGEAIYARECVFTLQTREKWYKQGRVVKPFETAYKVVKCWRYDKLKNEWLGNQPCDIFGIWQTEEYDPPTAENGIVPRNEYGNVELFTPKMLPKKTVHLQLPGLNRVCKRLGIDCAPALIGFDKARMRMIPVYDGFVVCEEYADMLTEEWYKEMEEEDRKEQERYEKRVYDNWKKLIKGVLVRRKLQNKYNFDNL
ncbi:DNA repair protein complementing XP-C cells homolog isoform X2 [Uranotaenia lowii]|nr:DNA repair protein complementing XP-C cells homolog isoform X2 [Uranotaenia lowii]